MLQCDLMGKLTQNIKVAFTAGFDFEYVGI